MVDHPESPRTWEEVAANDSVSLALLRVQKSIKDLELLRDQLKEMQAKQDFKVEPGGDGSPPESCETCQ